MEWEGWIHPMWEHDISPLSVFPDARTPGAWKLGYIPNKRKGSEVQGWKIHVAVHPQDQQACFDVLSPLLIRLQAAHKFLPIPVANRHQTGLAAWQQITAESNDGEGKSCFVYPRDPGHLSTLVDEIEGAIRLHNATVQWHALHNHDPNPGYMRPFPGGTKGDLKIGKSGFVFTRYGGFRGEMTDPRYQKVYDPFADDYVNDPRYDKPFPAFASNIPGQIRALM
ncbi:MAG: hypothetical protein AAFP16_10350 [Pseudomonadota bacterium]